MTGKELIQRLQALPEETLDLPVLYVDEVWLKTITDMVIDHENEYGLGPDIKHLRLIGERV